MSKIGIGQMFFARSLPPEQRLCEFLNRLLVEFREPVVLLHERPVLARKLAAPRRFGDAHAFHEVFDRRVQLVRYVESDVRTRNAVEFYSVVDARIRNPHFCRKFFS